MGSVYHPIVRSHGQARKILVNACYSGRCFFHVSLASCVADLLGQCEREMDVVVCGVTKKEGGPSDRHKNPGG